MTMEDQIGAAQRGDPVALSVVLEALAGRLRYVCGSIALDRGDDALQETLIVVMHNLSTLRDPNALWSWARTIAVREALRVVRAQRDVPVADVEGIAEHANRTLDPDIDTCLDVHAALRELPPHQRAVLVLRHLEGLSEDEVAHLLHVSPGTVKSRSFRARKRFAARWQS
jgi:RNA polymerase sigma factor (sigma-70 family)